MKKIYHITAVLLVGILLLTAGCTRKPESPISQKLTEIAGTTPAETISTTVPMDPLEALREEMEGTSYAFAVAYIGDTYADEKDFNELLTSMAPELCRQWPFLLDIPAENIVDIGWGEIYCIIPADPDATVRISAVADEAQAEWEYSNVLYESETGEPVLLVCNCSSERPDTQVTIISAEGETVWHPWQDKYRRVAPLTNEADEPLFLDNSDYTEIFTRIYQSNTEGMRLPTEEDLVGKAWGWEGTALYDEYYCTYLLGFEEDTAFIRWNDGIDEEDHEIHDIDWKLTYVDDFAVLTLDLREFAGLRSYNLLHDEECGWLYTMVDLSSGEVTVGEEIPFRSMEPRSLNVPDPVEMVGTWKRVRMEFEGYGEEDTSGNCTIVITGETEDTLAISYTDRERPESNYQNKTLDIRQGQIYWGCGNSLWLAEVDHVGHWDTTYTVTLLEDGTLLLQNYWEMDGAPAVSYAWYRRTEYGDSISPYDYARSQGWCLPELWELADTFWLSDSGYALELMDDSVSGDNGGWAKLYDVGENGAYTESHNGSWTYEDGMLHLSLVPLSDDGYFVDDSFPVLMQDGYLWIGRNAYGTGLPHFYADRQIDILEQPKG